MTRQPARFSKGDRVAFAASFLRSIADYSYAMAQRRGTVKGNVIEVRPGVHLVEIAWDGERRPSRALSTNLIRADKIHLEPN